MCFSLLSYGNKFQNGQSSITAERERKINVCIPCTLHILNMACCFIKLIHHSKINHQSLVEIHNQFEPPTEFKLELTHARKKKRCFSCSSMEMLFSFCVENRDRQANGG